MLALGTKQGAMSFRASTLFELKNALPHLLTSDATGRDKEIIDQKPLLWHCVSFSSARYQPVTPTRLGWCSVDNGYELWVNVCGLLVWFFPSVYLSDVIK